jgi:DNA-binding NtrC family response regulator
MSDLNNVSSLSTHTILAVDDERAIVQLCKAILETAGFSVLPATTSSEALKICKNHPGPIDLLLTDLVMAPPEFSIAFSENEFPHVHGHELAFQALRMRKNLRVVLMSGNVDRELAGYGIRRGDLPFLPKPFEQQDLVSLVRETLLASPPSIESLREAPPGILRSDDGWFG